MIPKIIWQTYKDPIEILPKYIKNVSETWKNKNPEYKYMYMNDEEARNFVKLEYGNNWVKIWDSCPLGVMKGDIWRYLIINSYGGIYADLDTVCKDPISSWIKDEYDAVLCIDDDNVNYAQLAFASTPQNPILLKVIELIEKAFEKPNYLNKNFVHDMTGVHIWTKAIKYVLNNGYDNVYIYKDENSNLFHNGAIEHLVASKNWNTEGYVQWQEEIKKI